MARPCKIAHFEFLDLISTAGRVADATAADGYEIANMRSRNLDHEKFLGRRQDRQRHIVDILTAPFLRTAPFGRGSQDPNI